MDDHEIVQQIEELVEEEHRLRDDGLEGDEAERLRRLEITLDRCWDMLRRRRAARRSGADPDEVGLRDAKTVEDYVQ